MTNPLEYADIVTTLGRLGLRDDPSGFHGVLCGALCRMVPGDIDPVQWLEEQADVVGPPGAPAKLQVPSAQGPLVGGMPLGSQDRMALRGLLVQIHESLGDADMSFNPLLPEDSAALSERAQALGAWCAGFLFGLAGRAHLDLERCSDEVREIVSDFTEFTRAMYAEQDDLEVEEGAYYELVEYVRISAQLVYMELHPRGTPANEQQPTLH
jgi:uncharacterized protein YgfB (UPF0149 family)